MEAVFKQGYVQLLTLQVPAKVNLTLEVLGKRPDGYHEIKSVMQAISLFDVLSFVAADTLELRCTAAELQSEENLVMKAARAIKETAGYAGGALITLDKGIPWEAGMGGGSSDAAATLAGLNRLWSLGLPREKLLEIAASLGSDVPFFIYGGTCLAEGRGERIAKIPDLKKTWFVLLKPALPGGIGKTGRLYGFIEPGLYTKGEYSESMKEKIMSGVGIEPSHLYNIFDSVALEAYPGIDRYYSIFREEGASSIHLAGSGPVLFTSVQGQETASRIHARLIDKKMQGFVVSSLPGDNIGF
ncbi:MAG: 4-(cytidine 5'-diphospho)-2-C-methyl-D-erythritol kinase [Dehalococcoidia bacterium]|nr:4-(cytidine 5'-diphospho)-2-C-methyl-D-erythritol kinase [Dehalococcoidia bacterium]